MKVLLVFVALVLAGCSEPSVPTHIGCQALSETQKAQLASQLADAARLAGSSDGAILEVSVLDQAWGTWRESLPSNADRIAKDIEAFGAAFGELLVRDVGFEWLHCTDDFGSGLAVVALRGAGDATIFPSDFVAKRHESGEGPSSPVRSCKFEEPSMTCRPSGRQRRRLTKCSSRNRFRSSFGCNGSSSHHLVSECAACSL